MNGRTRLIIGVLVAVVALGAFGYWFVLREPEAPSGPIEAIPLEKLKLSLHFHFLAWRSYCFFPSHPGF